MAREMLITVSNDRRNVYRHVDMNDAEEVGKLRAYLKRKAGQGFAIGKVNVIGDAMFVLVNQTDPNCPRVYNFGIQYVCCGGRGLYYHGMAYYNRSFNGTRRA